MLGPRFFIWTIAGILFALCLYCGGYWAHRRVGRFTLEYPLQFVNSTLGIDQRLVLTGKSSVKFGYATPRLEQMAELRDGRVIPLQSGDDPEREWKQMILHFYSPLLNLEFRNKQNVITDEDGYFSGALTAPTCEAGLQALLLRDTGIGDWKVTGGKGYYHKGDLSHGVRVIGTIHRADGELLVQKLTQTRGLFLRDWDLTGDFDHWERMGLKRPAPGAKGVILAFGHPDNKSESPSDWRLILESDRIQIVYLDGSSDG